MDTYGNNGICQFLISHAQNSNFFLTDLNKSMLIIAEKNTQEPLCIVLDDRVEREDYAVTESGTFNISFDEKEEEVINIGITISNKIRKPFYIISYTDGIKNDFNERKLIVGCYHAGDNSPEYIPGTIKCFVELLKKDGINAEYNKRSPEKKDNDKLSSDFHFWQRECLKVGIFTDIDLLRYDKETDNILQIYELKRSTEPFDEWKPYYTDINNYSILYNLCKMLDVPLYIIYNTQVKESDKQDIKKDYYYRVIKKGGEVFYDDVENIRILKMIYNDKLLDIVPISIGEMKIEDFIKSNVFEKNVDYELSDRLETYWNLNGARTSFIELEYYRDKEKKYYHLYPDCEFIKDKRNIVRMRRLLDYKKGYCRCLKCSKRNG